MHSRFRILSLVFPALVGLSHCNKASVSGAEGAGGGLTLVQEGVSPHFQTVASKLEIGGSSFTYAEEGEILDIISTLFEEVMKAMPEEEKAKLPPNFSFKKVFSLAGLDSIKASGMSSRKLPGGLNHSRSFVYTPEGRHGLLTLSGGPAEPFITTSLGVKDTDLALEFPLHLKDFFAEAWPVVMEYVPNEQRPMIEAMAGAPQPPLGVSYKEMVEKTSLRVAILATLMPEQSIAAPGAPVAFPGVNAAIVIDKLGWLTDVLKQQFLPMLLQPESPVELLSKGAVTVGRFKGPMGPAPMDFQPTFSLEDATQRLIIATRPGYLEALSKEARLAEQPEFTAAWNGLPKEGNGCVYVSKRFMTTLMEGIKTAATTSPTTDAAMVGKVMNLLSKHAGSSMAVAYANQPDGIFTAGNTTLPTASPGSISSITTMAMLSGLAAPMMSSVQQQGAHMKSMKDGRAVLAALKLHAAGHGGAYPAKLTDLLGGNLLAEPGVLMLTEKPGMDELSWLYDNSLAPDSPGISIVLAAPFTIRTGGKETRLVIRNDSRAEMIPEADFQRTKDYNLR